MSGTNFMALSHSDNDDERFQLDEDSPTRGHSRQGPAGEGHLYAGHHSTAGMHHFHTLEGALSCMA